MKIIYYTIYLNELIFKIFNNNFNKKNNIQMQNI